MPVVQKKYSQHIALPRVEKLVNDLTTSLYCEGAMDFGAFLASDILKSGDEKHLVWFKEKYAEYFGEVKKDGA